VTSRLHSALAGEHRFADTRDVDTPVFVSLLWNPIIKRFLLVSRSAGSYLSRHSVGNNWHGRKN
jgi:hypothetical protein